MIRKIRKFWRQSLTSIIVRTINYDSTSNSFTNWWYTNHANTDHFVHGRTTEQLTSSGSMRFIWQYNTTNVTSTAIMNNNLGVWRQSLPVTSKWSQISIHRHEHSNWQRAQVIYGQKWEIEKSKNKLTKNDDRRKSERDNKWMNGRRNEKNIYRLMTVTRLSRQATVTIIIVHHSQFFETTSPSVHRNVWHPPTKITY